jgi:hypothetical protein
MRLTHITLKSKQKNRQKQGQGTKEQKKKKKQKKQKKTEKNSTKNPVADQKTKDDNRNAQQSTTQSRRYSSNVLGSWRVVPLLLQPKGRQATSSHGPHSLDDFQKQHKATAQQTSKRLGLSEIFLSFRRPSDSLFSLFHSI